jgi:hypothetical protein
MKHIDRWRRLSVALAGPSPGLLPEERERKEQS